MLQFFCFFPNIQHVPNFLPVFGYRVNRAMLSLALVQDPDINIMQQSHGLFVIAKLLC